MDIIFSISLGKIWCDFAPMIDIFRSRAGRIENMYRILGVSVILI